MAVDGQGTPLTVHVTAAHANEFFLSRSDEAQALERLFSSGSSTADQNLPALGRSRRPRTPRRGTYILCPHLRGYTPLGKLHADAPKRVERTSA